MNKDTEFMGKEEVNNKIHILKILNRVVEKIS